MPAKTFEEWIHDNLENEHEPTNSHGWLRRAWDASREAAFSWISVSDRLPEIAEGVLITDGKEISIGQRRPVYPDYPQWQWEPWGFGGYEYDWDLDCDHVTHWMPLPEFPGVPKMPERDMAVIHAPQESTKFTVEHLSDLARWAEEHKGEIIPDSFPKGVYQIIGKGGLVDSKWVKEENLEAVLCGACHGALKIAHTEISEYRNKRSHLLECQGCGGKYSAVEV